MSWPSMIVRREDEALSREQYLDSPCKLGCSTFLKACHCSPDTLWLRLPLDSSPTGPRRSSDHIDSDRQTGVHSAVRLEGVVERSGVGTKSSIVKNDSMRRFHL